MKNEPAKLERLRRLTGSYDAKDPLDFWFPL